MSLAMPDLTGARLGGGAYELVRLVGEGGMGRVYEARVTATGAAVAIKVLHPHLAAEPKHLARFRREAEAAQALAHPNIVRVHAFGQEPDGSAFLEMELLVGLPLDRVVRGGKALPVERALDIADQVLAALGAAHAAAIVHRDLKPANVFLCREGDRERVKLLDFGIAKLRRTALYSSLTTQGRMIGTPRFMAPEQLTGGDVDERTDLYALGVLLYRLLSGRSPFEHDDLARLTTDILTGTYTPLSRSAPEVPREVAHCVDKAMARDPDGRFDSASALAIALREAVRGRMPVAGVDTRALPARGGPHAASEDPATAVARSTAGARPFDPMPATHMGAAPSGTPSSRAPVTVPAAVVGPAAALAGAASAAPPRPSRSASTGATLALEAGRPRRGSWIAIVLGSALAGAAIAAAVGGAVLYRAPRAAETSSPASPAPVAAPAPLSPVAVATPVAVEPPPSEPEPAADRPAREERRRRPDDARRQREGPPPEPAPAPAPPAREENSFTFRQPWAPPVEDPQPTRSGRGVRVQGLTPNFPPAAPSGVARAAANCNPFPADGCFTVMIAGNGTIGRIVAAQRRLLPGTMSCLQNLIGPRNFGPTRDQEFASGTFCYQ